MFFTVELRLMIIDGPVEYDRTHPLRHPVTMGPAYPGHKVAGRSRDRLQHTGRDSSIFGQPTRPLVSVALVHLW